MASIFGETVKLRSFWKALVSGIIYLYIRVVYIYIYLKYWKYIDIHLKGKDCLSNSEATRTGSQMKGAVAIIA